MLSDTRVRLQASTSTPPKLVGEVDDGYVGSELGFSLISAA